MTLHFTPLYIQGEKRNASDGGKFPVRNPNTGETIGEAASATGADCQAAIASAGAGLAAWEAKSIIERRDVFLRAAHIVSSTEYKQKIIDAVQLETGASLFMATLNWMGAAGALRMVAGHMGGWRGDDTFASGAIPGGQVVVSRRAMGVVLAIAPWNAPFALALRAIGLPLVCGNTVLLKSSEMSPRSQALVMDLFEEAGLPHGVLNFINISRESSPALTAEIIAHPLVRCINFTGSDIVGRIIATEAAKYLKPCVLELGGKSASIVLDDANIEEAAKAIVFGAMIHSGQICISTERVIVQRGVSSTLLARVCELAGSLKIGDAQKDASVTIGALFTEASAERVVGLIKDAQKEGAEVVLGDVQRVGALVRPHVVNGLKPGMKLWDRESFGPVVGFVVVDTVDEAIELANTSEYSLSAALWTSDVHNGQKLAARVRSGLMNINGPTFHSEPAASIQGLSGASGYGRFDIESFTNKCVIVTHPAGNRNYPIFS